LCCRAPEFRECRAFIATNGTAFGREARLRARQRRGHLLCFLRRPCAILTEVASSLRSSQRRRKKTCLSAGRPDDAPPSIPAIAGQSRNSPGAQVSRPARCFSSAMRATMCSTMRLVSCSPNSRDAVSRRSIAQTQSFLSPSEFACSSPYR